MKFPRLALSSALLLASQLVPVSCGGNDVSDLGAAGRGGSAGSDASAGTAGSSGKAGAPGGASASGGSDGAAAAGADGAGKAGSAGSAGIDGSGGSDAGDGAAGTDAGDGSQAAPKACIEKCVGDGDCKTRTADGGALDTGFVCVNQQCVPRDPTLGGCSVSADCLAAGSQWRLNCSVTGDAGATDGGVACPSAFFACINVGRGVGKCASKPGTPPCNFTVPDRMSMPLIDGSGEVEVCGNTSYRCNPEAKTCFSPCEDSDCNAGSMCNHTTGQCDCVSDAGCQGASGAGVSRCNLATHRCECGSHADCSALPERKLCVAGKCSCDTTQACIKTFDGTTESCE